MQKQILVLAFILFVSTEATSLFGGFGGFGGFGNQWAQPSVNPANQYPQVPLNQQGQPIIRPYNSNIPPTTLFPWLSPQNPTTINPSNSFNLPQGWDKQPYSNWFFCVYPMFFGFPPHPQCFAPPPAPAPVPQPNPGVANPDAQSSITLNQIEAVRKLDSLIPKF
eukprot:c7476_g1_i1.p1 GENE.c7476_g1_i1~~c7476_g1_i1.p1  ORF type:complete len:165 (-),score=79.58 c7476_g1_i1:85-579(-)